MFSSVGDASSGTKSIKTSQFALTAESCAAVYASAGYELSKEHLATTSLESDNVFRDGFENQLAQVVDDGAGAYTATLQVAIV